MQRKFKVCYMGGNQAGLTGLLTLLAYGVEVRAVVSYTDYLLDVARRHGVSCYVSIKSRDFQENLKGADFLLSVHGREIVPEDMLGRTRLGGVNVHPYLYAYKGASPVKRAVADKNLKASVGVHWMTSQVDQGEVIVERFVNLASAESETEVYNQLYPQYALVIAEALERIGGM